MKKLVQLLFIPEWQHRFWNSSPHEGVYTLCMLEFDLQNLRLHQQQFCSTFQQKTLWNIYALSQSYECILAVCIQMRAYRSFEFARKNFLRFHILQ